MVFAELFMVLIFILAALAVIRWGAKKWRRAGIVGKMNQIEETEQTAAQIRQFEKDHKNPEAAQKTVDRFNQGQ